MNIEEFLKEISNANSDSSRCMPPDTPVDDNRINDISATYERFGEASDRYRAYWKTLDNLVPFLASNLIPYKMPKQYWNVNRNKVSNGKIIDKLKNMGLKLIESSSDGNCLFTSVVRRVVDIITSRNTNVQMLDHLNNLGINPNYDVDRNAHILRKRLVNEFLINRARYLQFGTFSEMDYISAASEFNRNGHFEGSLGDHAILGLANVIQMPIIVIMPNQNFRTFTVLPAINLANSETTHDVVVVYDDSGSGHYDSAVQLHIGSDGSREMDDDASSPCSSQSSNGSLSTSQKLLLTEDDCSKKLYTCRCGVNKKTEHPCGGSNKYNRCKCLKNREGCSRACKCKNCVNEYGRRSTILIRSSETGKHQTEEVLVNTRKEGFDVVRSLTAMQQCLLLAIVASYLTNTAKKINNVPSFKTVGKLYQAVHHKLFKISNDNNTLTLTDAIVRAFVTFLVRLLNSQRN